MKRVAVFAMLVALAISAGVQWTVARAVAPSNELLQLLPDGDGVVLIDVQRLTSSSLWTTLSSQGPLKEGLDKAQNELTKVGLRLSDIHTAAIAFPHKGSHDPAVAVTGNFNRTDLLNYLRGKENMKVTSEKYKEFEVFTVGTQAKPADGAFAFIDQRTVVAGSPDSVRASIDVRTGTKPSIAQNSKLASALAANPAATISFAIDLPSGIGAPGGDSPIPLPDFSSIKMIFGTVDTTDAIDLNATLRAEKAEQASGIARSLTALLDMAKGYLGAMNNDPKMAKLVEALKTVSITGADTDVKITGRLPQDLLTQLMK